MTTHNSIVASLDTGSDPRNEQRNGSLIEELPAREELPTNEEVARLAYEIYLERGCAPGQDVNDWLQAERELQERAGGT